MANRLTDIPFFKKFISMVSPAIGNEEFKVDNQLLAANEMLDETNHFYNTFQNFFPINCVENNMTVVYVDALYKKNVELIKGCIVLYELDNITSMLSLLRIILEGIITMFYLVLKETKVTNYETKIDYNLNDLHRSEIVKKIIRKYQASNMIDALYVGNNFKSVKKYYKTFSSSIHNDYRAHIENPTDDIKWQTFGLIPSLNLLNTFAMIQAYMDTAKEKDVVKFAGAFISSLMVVYGDKFGSFIPNKQEIFKKLLFKESIRRHVNFTEVNVD